MYVYIYIYVHVYIYIYVSQMMRFIAMVVTTSFTPTAPPIIHTHVAKSYIEYPHDLFYQPDIKSKRE